MQLLPDRLQVVRHLGERIRLSIEVAEHLGSGRLGLDEIIEIEAKLLGEMLDGEMAVVDQLAAMLVKLPVREHPLPVQHRPPRRLEAS